MMHFKKTTAFLTALAMLSGVPAVLPMADILIAVAEVGDHAAQETAAELTIGTAFTDELTESDAENWYKFTTTEDGSFTVDVSHSKQTWSSSYWKITVYQDNDGTLREFRSWDVDGSSEKTTTDALGVPAGSYYIKVTSGSYHSADAYDLTVNFSAGGWETEFNDLSENADEIETGQTYNGLLHLSDDTDWYRFTTEEDGCFTIDFVHIDKQTWSGSYWTITVYQNNDGKMKKFRSWDVGGQVEKTTTDALGVPAGEYYIEITSASYSTTSPYELTVNFVPNSDETKDDWETEFNDYEEDADIINVNQTYNGLLHLSDDVDWYRFTADTAGSFTIDFVHIDKQTWSGSYWTITVYQNADGKMREFRSWGIGGQTERTTTSGLGIPAGDYYIKVESASYHTTSPYELTVNFTSAAQESWEEEFNDTKDAANTINLNQKYNGSIYNSDDTDWYKFSLASECDLTIKFENDKQEYSSSYWKVTLYQGNSAYDSWNMNGSDLGQNIDIEALPAGDYYLEITSGTYSSTSVYTFVVSDGGELIVPEIPDTTEPATPSDSRIWGDIDGNGTVDAADAAMILMYAAEVGAGMTDVSLEEYVDSLRAE